MARLNLHPGETLQHIYRQSEMVLVKPLVVILVALYIPWFFAVRYDMVFDFRRWLLLWTIIVLIYGVRSYVIWSLNRYVVTSERLVRMSYEGLFKKTVIETPLERILNVSYKTTGIMSALFRHGDVEIQVVGLIEPVILKNIRQPREIKDYLWQLHQQKAGRQASYNNEHIAHIQETAGYTKKNQKVL